MWTGVFPVLAQLAVIVAGCYLLLWPDNDKATGKDAYTKETDMMILEMLYCDECHRPLTPGKEHRCPPKRFCLEGGCGTPFYSHDPARTLCIVHASYGGCGDASGFATGLLGKIVSSQQKKERQPWN